MTGSATVLYDTFVGLNTLRDNRSDEVLLDGRNWIRGTVVSDAGNIPDILLNLVRRDASYRSGGG